MFQIILIAVIAAVVAFALLGIFAWKKERTPPGSENEDNKSLGADTEKIKPGQLGHEIGNSGQLPSTPYSNPEEIPVQFDARQSTLTTPNTHQQENDWGENGAPKTAVDVSSSLETPKRDDTHEPTEMGVNPHGESSPASSESRELGQPSIPGLHEILDKIERLGSRLSDLEGRLDKSSVAQPTAPSTVGGETTETPPSLTGSLEKTDLDKIASLIGSLEEWLRTQLDTNMQGAKELRERLENVEGRINEQIGQARRLFDEITAFSNQFKTDKDAFEQNVLHQFETLTVQLGNQKTSLEEKLDRHTKAFDDVGFKFRTFEQNIFQQFAKTQDRIDNQKSNLEQKIDKHITTSNALDDKLNRLSVEFEKLGLTKFLWDSKEKIEFEVKAAVQEKFPSPVLTMTPAKPSPEAAPSNQPIRQIDGDLISFTQTQIESAPDAAGVYALYDKGGNAIQFDSTDSTKAETIRDRLQEVLDKHHRLAEVTAYFKFEISDQAEKRQAELVNEFFKRCGYLPTYQLAK